MMRTARCACGGLSLTAEGDPVLNALCHCSDCRRRTGSAFGWQTYFLEAQITDYSGIATQRSVPVAEPQTRHFCPSCGTTLWWTVATAPGMVGVAAGAFDPGTMAEPVATYRDDNRCDWLMLPDLWTRYP